ncbi:toxin-antitoxin system YwqK family antitoxin [Shewanella sp. NIFS-20-20]|uniref:toxin-antitoxin system YwqK family antitoxin n=1 Tax=Shewanella sp. NIFS-20-20 TaxID=2853806 RepID=UPI001C48EE4C|nr:hypothetical protein [Shewanella sp. NIFS-20-20]MBV7316305.1 hypothetical protein [Shewanella sp. NIFS-20-20]
MPIDAYQLEPILCQEDDLGQSQCLNGYQGQPFTGIATYGSPQGFYLITQYLNGKAHGYMLGFIDGQLSRFGQQEHGQFVGERLSYYAHLGQLRSQELYQQGQLLERKQYTEDGMIDRSYHDQDGELVEEISYMKGLPWRYFYSIDGEARQRVLGYFANGVLESEAEYLAEDLKKLNSRSFYSSGQLKTRFSYDRKSDTALLESFFTNGQMQTRQQYGFNPGINRHGYYQKFCQENGQLQETVYFDMGTELESYQHSHCNGQ